MKKALSAAALLLAAVLCLHFAAASGGSAGDPLISLSYLEDAFSRSVQSAVDSRLDTADSQVSASVRKELETMGTSASGGLSVQSQEADLKRGDALTGSTGLLVTPLAGELTLSLSSGAVVDATEGREVPSGTVLTCGHRYLVAERSSAQFTAASSTAAVLCQGAYTLSPSTGVPNYYAIAGALRELDLFRGTGSGFGQGFDLHLAPTRAEGLVMFIRILGEEDEALACTGSHPFTDVPGWLDRYAAWAWQRGYTNGVSPTLFAPAQTISAAEYQEFLLRALGYSSAGSQDYTTSPERALACGVLTQGELSMLREEPFLRAQVAYISYYSLDAFLNGSSETLAQRLTAAGLFTEAQLQQARSMVDSFRLP